MSERVTLTDAEKQHLADRVLGGASPSPLMVRAVERIVAARLEAVAVSLETDAAATWGGPASWLTTGQHVANLAADWVRTEVAE